VTIFCDYCFWELSKQRVRERTGDSLKNPSLYHFIEPSKWCMPPSKLLLHGYSWSCQRIGVRHRWILKCRSATRTAVCMVIWINKFIFTWSELGRERESRNSQAVFKELSFMLHQWSKGLKTKHRNYMAQHTSK